MPVAERKPAPQVTGELLGGGTFDSASLTGKVIGIEQVSDQVFADKILGDGVAVIPADGKVYAPADGVETEAVMGPFLSEPVVA